MDPREAKTGSTPEGVNDADTAPRHGERVEFHSDHVNGNGLNGRSAPLPAASATLAVPEPAPIPDVYSLLKALRHRWLLALSLGLFCAVAAGALTHYLLPTTLQRSTVLAKIRLQTAEVQLPNFIWNPALDTGAFRTTQCELIKSSPVLSAALDSPELADNPITKMPRARALMYLESELRAAPKGQSEIIEISMLSDNGQAAADIVNAVANAYLQVSQEEERHQRELQLEAYVKIQQNYARDLESRHRQLIKSQDMLNAIERAEARLNDVSARLELAQLQLKFLNENKSNTTNKVEPSAFMIEEEMSKDADLVRLTRDKMKLDNLIDAYKGIAVPGSQLERNALNGYSYDRDRIERQIEKRRAEIRPRIVASLQRSIAEPPEQNLPRVLDKVGILKLEKESAQAKLAELEAQVQKEYGKKAEELRVESLQAKAHEEVAPQFAQAIEAFKLRINSPSRLSLLQSAVAPPAADPHRQSKTVAIASIGAFLFVGFCTAWFEFRARRIHNPDELVRELRLRMLGTMPALPERVRLRPQAIDSSRDHRLQSAVTESADSIRAMLVHEGRMSALRTIMITSAVGSEGKTTLASQLAINLAQAGHKILLIDCDFLKPMVNHLFELPLTPGICEAMRGDIEPETAVVKSQTQNLWIMPAGSYDRRVSQAIARGDFPKLLDQLKQDYEYVIIDSCPVLSVANTLMIGQHVDAVVLAVLRDRSQIPRVYAAYQRLAVLGIRVVGTVFNKVRSDMYGYYGYYGYGHNNESSSTNSDPSPA